MDTLNTLLDDLAELNAERGAAYAELITDLAAGRHPGKDKVDSILRAANKSPRDLETAVCRFIHRGTWRNLVNDAAKASDEMAEVKRLMGLATEELRAAEARHGAIMRELGLQAQALQARLNSGRNAAAELRRTADPQAKQELDVLAARQRQKEANRATMTARLEEAEAQAKNLAGREQYLKEFQGAEMRRDLFRQQIEAADAELADLEKEVLEQTRALLEV